MLTPNTLSDPSLAVPFEGRGLNVNDRLVNINARTGTIICKKLLADEVNGGSGNGEYQSVTLAGTFDVLAAVAAGTQVNIPGMELTLPAGRHLVHYGFTCIGRITRVWLVDDEVVPQIIPGSITTGGTTTTSGYNTHSETVVVNLTRTTTLRAQVTISIGAPEGLVIVNTTGFFNDPDADGGMWALNFV